MISPEEIRMQALKWWVPFLQSHVHNEPFFPKQIDRIGKVQPAHVTQRFEALQNEIETLYKNSKNEGGTGYLIKTSGKKFRRTGVHELPDSIVFDSADDYLHFTGKRKEWKLFLRNYELLMGSLPQLKEWIVTNINLLTSPANYWDNILKVCHYFIVTPRPNLYLRQLPITIHTKFIEENSALLQSLLNFLIPAHIRNILQKRFAERYFLKHDEPLIRIRILDEKLAIHNNLTDISIRLSDFEKTGWDSEIVLIAENKMNFLTLPSLPSAIAIWSGGGFNVSYLRNASWLKTKKMHYWGDIDEHGFQILHQIRSYYPQTQSLLMDRQTFDTFHEYTVIGERNKAERLCLLNEEETNLYNFLKSIEDRNRLEQEKIPQSYVDAELGKLLY
ncbi:MAG: Wadjet anti-phage system protein JetD domain-containing protein [Chitinophagaceae bacterium]